jgi:antitoxin component of MazEF toxin-antitoxin module
MTNVSVIQIGNSWGVRLPRGVLEELAWGLGRKIELELGDDSLVLRPKKIMREKKRREGWEEQLARATKNGEKKAPESELNGWTDFDLAAGLENEDWQWLAKVKPIAK